MGKLLFILGLLPVIVGIAMRKWFGERVLRRMPMHSTRITAGAFLVKLEEGAELGLEVKSGRRTRLSNEALVLSQEVSEVERVVPLAKAGLLFGLALLGQKQPELLRWRLWALKFSWALPAFLILILIFSALVGSLVRWALPILSVGLGLGTMVSFLAAWIEWQAAGLAGQFLASRPILAREDDRIAVSKAMRALAARRCVPGILGMFFPEKNEPLV